MTVSSFCIFSYTASVLAVGYRRPCRACVCPAFRPRRMKTEKRRPDLRCWNHRSLSIRARLCPVHGLVLFHVLCHVPSSLALCLVLCVPGHLRKKEWMPTLSAYQGHHQRMRYDTWDMRFQPHLGRASTLSISTPCPSSVLPSPGSTPTERPP